MNQSYIISTLVENKPGVLQKVSSMFRSRGFNIDSISVGVTEKKDLSRMTITVHGDASTVEQLVKQLSKLIDVIKVSVLEEGKAVYRELALVKVHCPNGNIRSEIVGYANIFKAKVVDISKDSIMVEITGRPDKIDAFIELVNQFGIKELARTGVTALTRG
jgi:acetolactate synthase-1/3 small subunit